jgi:hypothetical protein
METTIRIPFTQCYDAVLPNQFRRFFEANERAYCIAEKRAFTKCGWPEHGPMKGGVWAYAECDGLTVEVYVDSDNAGQDVERELRELLWKRRCRRDSFKATCLKIHAWWLKASDSERENTRWYSFECPDELSIEDLSEYVGQHYSDLPEIFVCHGAWPVLDRDSLVIKGIVLNGMDISDYLTVEIRNGGIEQCEGGSFLVHTISAPEGQQS